MINQIVSADCVKYKLDASSVTEAVLELLKLATLRGSVVDPEVAAEAIFLKEATRPTCWKNGVCFPRSCAHGVQEITFMVGRFSKPVECDCGKRHRVQIVLCLVGPIPLAMQYLRVMKEIVSKLHLSNNGVELISAKDQDDLYERLIKALK